MTFEEIERAVAKLRPIIRNTGDRIFRVECCGTMLGWTKRSMRKGRGKDAGPDIVAAIPRQLNIESRLWREIAGCTKGRPDYLEARGHGGHA